MGSTWNLGTLHLFGNNCQLLSVGAKGVINAYKEREVNNPPWFRTPHSWTFHLFEIEQEFCLGAICSGTNSKLIPIFYNYFKIKIKFSLHKVLCHNSKSQPHLHRAFEYALCFQPIIISIHSQKYKIKSYGYYNLIVQASFQRRPESSCDHSDEAKCNSVGYLALKRLTATASKGQIDTLFAI